MKTIHPTDTEIQEYSLNANPGSPIAAHIGHCRQCAVMVQQYQQLFEGIKQQPAPVFDFDLNQLVMQQLPVAQTIKSTDKYFVYTIYNTICFSTSCRHVSII